MEGVGEGSRGASVGIRTGAGYVTNWSYNRRKNASDSRPGNAGRRGRFLYLVVFAATKRYGFLLMTLSLVVMIGLVTLSCVLAVLQDFRFLAVFGIVGGFLAPVLMSTGGGSDVMLFSYYASSIWALEGAGMVWVGVRQRRVVARLFGLLLQLAATYIFLDSVWYPFTALPFANRYFLGCVFLSLAALFSSYFLDRYSSELKKWERFFPLSLMMLGLAWWYIGGLREIDKQIVHSESVNGFLLYCCASSILMGMALRKIDWPRFGLSLYLQLPAMIFLLLISLFGSHFISHLLDGWGAVAWTVAFVIQYRILYLFAGAWPKRNMVAWHLGTMWLLLFVLSHEASWAMSQLSGLGEVWTMICWALIPSSGLLLLLHLGRGVSWPVGKYGSFYLREGGVIPALGLLLWTIISFSVAGDPAPLPYVPFFNPVEISGLVVVITLVLWLLNLKNNAYALKYLSEKQTFWGVSVVFFFWLNSVVARTVHFYAGILYHPESLYRSVIFQAAIASLWCCGALAITVWATRKGSRPLWGVGAMLLGMVVLKLFLIDLSGTGTIARIISFLVVGVLMLIIGYFFPLPPKKEVKIP